MNWIPFEDFEKKIVPSTKPVITKYLKNQHKKVVKLLQEKYPTPREWFSASIPEKKIRYKNISELEYILFWAWEMEIYIQQEFKSLLYEYLISYYSGSGTASQIKRWSKRKALITVQEWESIKQRHPNTRGIMKTVVFLALFLMKPFAQITDVELDKTPFVYTRITSKKIINDFRIELGYTETIVKKRSENNWTNILHIHPLWGEIFKDYHNYLIRANAKNRYMNSVGYALTLLLKYMKKNSIKDCSNFTWVNFTHFTDYLLETKKVSSVSILIAKYKKFFSWGTNEHKFFPKKLDFPETYWKSLNKKAKEYHKTSDGRAFTNEKIVDEVVKILKKYKPVNEIEQLCLYFWLIITSCPARSSFVLNIEAEGALQRLPNELNAYGLYSRNSDKSGNKGGVFPFVDSLGIDAVTALQTRLKNKNFKPLYNTKFKRSYVHLFQLANSPWVVDNNMIWSFFHTKIKPKVASVLEIEHSFKGGAHGFRHHILTEILKRTGSLEATQVAAGHINPSMTKTYIKSIHAKKALLYRAIEKYEHGEITGKFYLRLIEALTTNEPTSELLKDLTKDLTMEEFIKKHGRKTDMGICFDEDGTCNHYLKCWSCPSFMMRREEIEGAIALLKKLVLEFVEFKNESLNFSYTNTITQNKLTAIALIKERLSDLKVDEEEITSMIFN
ncbi:site-specific integrase [Bacillus mycoides]|uniref:hypothetical protein n=1 Tax=Bacillus mycoides TaxID=1405 RepID=UPI0038301AEC